MTGLRIVFEVDEKHVGGCLVALEGKAKNLNFEVIAEVEWQKNKPVNGAGKKNKLPVEFVLEQLKATPAGLDKGNLGSIVKQAGYKVQGLNSILLSLLKKKIVKKVGSAYQLAKGANS